MLTLAPEPEQRQDQVDSFSQGVSETEQAEPTEKQSENAVQEAIEDPEQSSKDNIEVKKTWGFRRSTVAQRDMPVEPAGDSPDNPCPVRRSGRQSKRTDKLEEFLSTAKRTFRKSAPPSLESGDPPSQTPTDAETTSEASFDGSADTKSESPERRTRSSTRKPAQIKTQVGRQTRSRSGGASKEDGSSENEDSKEGGLKNTEEETKDEETKDGKNIPDNTNAGDKPQMEQSSEKKEDKNGGNKSDKATDDTEDDNEAPEKPAVLVKRGPIRTYINKKRAANKNTTPVKSPAPVNKVTPVKEIKARVAKTRKPQTQDDMEDENESSTSSSSSSSSSSSDESDEGSYDPNALYCICRQKHNKRFMICCDRCEEWFHGDCVGITEARGRLMERNGEDYICPNCTAKKNQVVRPATSALSANTDKPKADNAAVASSEKTKETDQAVLLLSTAAEERATDDLGIKGRIEKASNPTGKKKIKIFQPQVAQQAAESKAEQPAASTAEQKAPPDTVHKVASNVEVDTTAVPVEQAEEKVEESALPKCIGPGCENNAQPDSVYCGPDCILKHAAATMKSITDPSQKDKAKPQKSKTKSATDGKKRQKKGHKQADSDEDYSPDPDEEDEDVHAEEQPPHPSTASWSSDHNYIAVTPEKTTPISSTVLNKKCMYLFEGLQLMLKPHSLFLHLTCGS